MRSRLGHLLVLIACVLMVSARAEANAGAPWGGGSHAGEPGGIEAIRIAHEELVIDLRPLAERDGQVFVAATYHLDNPVSEQQLDLVFATGSDSTDFRVMLDGRPVQLTNTRPTPLPKSWRAPSTTPLFDGSELQYHLAHADESRSFQLVVPPGRHDLAVSYRSDAVRYHHGDPTVLWQFAYVLSPARTWAGFGGLDVTVHVPAGWRAAVEPALIREGDMLRGTFENVPADALALTIQAPVGNYTLVADATRVVFLLVVIGGGFVVAWRTRAAHSGSWLAALGRGFAWGAAVLATGVLAIAAPELTLPEGQADHHGYGQALAYVGVVLASVVAVVIGAIVSRVVGRRV
jgi:hypothetical protein